MIILAGILLFDDRRNATAVEELRSAADRVSGRVRLCPVYLYQPLMMKRLLHWPRCRHVHLRSCRLFVPRGQVWLVEWLPGGGGLDHIKVVRGIDDGSARLALLSLVIERLARLCLRRRRLHRLVRVSMAWQVALRRLERELLGRGA